MNQLTPVFKKEFFGYFRSPVGYVILVTFHLLALGLAFFFNYFENNQASLDVLFRFLPWVLLVFISATGMRLWSEEKRSGSIELLFTLPIPISAAVLGKYLAALGFVAIALALTFSLAITTEFLGNPDWGVMLSGYFGSFLVAATYLAISSLCSSLTKNQVIAFVISILACFLVTIMGSETVLTVLQGFMPSGLVNYVANLSILVHFQTLSMGLIQLSAVSFFLAITAACLAINIVILQK